VTGLAAEGRDRGCRWRPTAPWTRPFTRRPPFRGVHSRDGGRTRCV